MKHCKLRKQNYTYLWFQFKIFLWWFCMFHVPLVIDPLRFDVSDGGLAPSHVGRNISGNLSGHVPRTDELSPGRPLRPGHPLHQMTPVICDDLCETLVRVWPLWEHEPFHGDATFSWATYIVELGTRCDCNLCLAFFITSSFFYNTRVRSGEGKLLSSNILN